MPRFTDEQVEAARNASFDYLESRGCFSVLFPGDAEIEVDAENDDEVNQVLHDAMRAALTAAADAAPAVDTTEFEASLREFGARSRLAHGGYLVGNKERENEFNALAEKTFSRLLDMFREAAR